MSDDPTEPDSCNHHWITHPPGDGRVPCVQVCSLCHTINWEWLAARIEERVDTKRWLAAIDGALKLEPGGTYVLCGLYFDEDSVKPLADVAESAGVKFLVFPPDTTIAQTITKGEALSMSEATVGGARYGLIAATHSGDALTLTYQRSAIPPSQH